MTELLHSPADSAAPFPMTETQQALMIGRGEGVELGSIGCYGYFEWERADLDPERFTTAWRRVVARHDMLRAVGRSDGTQHVHAEPRRTTYRSWTCGTPIRRTWSAGSRGCGRR